MKKLEWRNLKDGFCPKCYSELDDDDKSPYITCLASGLCDFSIKRERYDEILEDIYKEEAGNNAENA